MAFLAGKSPYIRSYTVCIYGSGQPYVQYIMFVPLLLYIVSRIHNSFVFKAHLPPASVLVQLTSFEHGTP